MRPLLLSLVAVLVVTAGCSALVDDAADRETVTPVDVPAVETPLAPGVPAATDGGAPRTVDTAQLRAADTSVRAARSYRLTRTVTIDGAEGTVRIDRERVTAPDGAAVEQFSTSSTGLFTTAVVESELWTDGTRVWTRSTLSDGTTVPSRRQPSPPPFHTVGLDLQTRLLGAADYRVVGSSDGVVTLRSTTPIRLARSAVPVALDDQRNGTAWLRVSSEGLVVGILLRYDARFGDTPVRVTIRQSTRDVGAVEVERPAWVGVSEPTAAAEPGG